MVATFWIFGNFLATFWHSSSNFPAFYEHNRDRPRYAAKQSFFFSQISVIRRCVWQIIHFTEHLDYLEDTSQTFFPELEKYFIVFRGMTMISYANTSLHAVFVYVPENLIVFTVKLYSGSKIHRPSIYFLDIEFGTFHQCPYIYLCICSPQFSKQFILHSETLYSGNIRVCHSKGNDWPLLVKQNTSSILLHKPDVGRE